MRDQVFMVGNVFIVANARLQQRGKDDAHGSQVGVQGRHKRPQPAQGTHEWAHQGVTKCELQTCAPQKLQIDAGANTSLTRRAHPPNDSGARARMLLVPAIIQKKVAVSALGGGGMDTRG